MRAFCRLGTSTSLSSGRRNPRWVCGSSRATEQQQNVATPFTASALSTTARLEPPAFQQPLPQARSFSSSSTNVKESRSSKSSNSNAPPSSKSKGKGRGKTATDKTKELLDTAQIPVGSFTTDTWSNTRKLLEWWIRLETPGAIKTALQLLERSVAEQQHAVQNNNQGDAGNWITNKKLLDRLVRGWKSCVEQEKQVIPAIALVARLLKLSHRLADFPLDIKMFSLILGVAVEQASPEQVLATTELLMNALTESVAKGNTNMQPNIVVWNQVLKACKKSSRPAAAKQADDVLQIMRDAGIAPDRLTFDSVIYTHAVAGNTTRAEELLQQMMAENQDGNERAKPGVISCNMVLLSYLKSREGGTAKRAEEFLDLMHQGAIPDVQPDYVSYNTVMECFASVGNAKGAEATMKRMKHHLVKDSEMPVKQSSISYSILIEAWAKAREPEQAEQTLNSVLDESLTDPNIRMFNAVLRAWASSKDPNALERAKQLLDLLQANQNCIGLGIRPDVDGFNSYLRCIAKSNNTDAGKESEATICKMEEQYREGNTTTKPNAESFTIAIKTCLECGEQVRAEALLKQGHLSGLSPESLDRIRSAWSKVESLSILDRAEQLFSRAQTLSESSEAHKLDIWDVNLVLAGLARSKEQGSLEILEKIYDELDTGRLGVNPDHSTYFTVVACLAKSAQRETLEKAERILRQMAAVSNVDVSPNSVLYGNVIRQWIRMGDLERAEDLLDFMQSDYESGNAAARSMGNIFVDVLNAWISQGDMERAQGAFQKMEELRSKDQSAEGPTVTVAETLLEAWKQSEHPNKEEYIVMLELQLKDVVDDTTLQ